MNTAKLIGEFEKQRDTLLNSGYPAAAKKTKDQFRELLDPLSAVVEQITAAEIDIENGYLPFVIVIKSEIISVEKKMSLVMKDGKAGITKLYPHEPKDFEVIHEERIPTEPVYMLVDIKRGKDNRNIPPNEALKMIRSASRHPLTIDEGVAIVTHYPEFLMKNNCFSLLASRHSGDQRVPAIWINGARQPNLGWCWDGNPHTWLGSASCATRIGHSK